MRLRPFGAWSIATRLVIFETALSTVILLGAGLLLSAFYQRATEQAFDARLGVYLRAIVADVATPGDEERTSPGAIGDPQFELALSGWYWQITRLDSGGPNNIKASRSLFAARLPHLADVGIPPGIGGYRAGYAIGPDDRRLRIVERVIDVGDTGIYLVQVAATTEDMENQIWQFNVALNATFLLLALALAGTIAVQVRFGLQPLRQLRDEVASIRRGESERIGGTFSEDLAPLGREVNLLIASNREIVERARTHVGNLAHALKTPLSVLLNEAAADQTMLADKVREQAAVMRDQVTYHLDRARAAARANVIGQVTDTQPVVEGLLRTFEKIYRDRQVRFEANLAADLRFRGEKQDLEEMVGNLIDNAGKWATSRVVVAIASEAGETPDTSFLSVTIDDDGPGLPAASRREALSRGARLDETKPGSGLGLSIVADLASLYGGKLALADSPLKGLRAALQLPSV